MTEMKQTSKGTNRAMPKAEPFKYSYNIHDIVTIGSDGYLPELEPFRVQTNIQQPTIQVRIGIPRSPEKGEDKKDRKSTRLNSSHIQKSRMPSSA